MFFYLLLTDLNCQVIIQATESFDVAYIMAISKIECSFNVHEMFTRNNINKNWPHSWRSSETPYQKNYNDERHLGIMGDQLRASVKPLGHRSTTLSRGFKGGPSIGPPWCRETLYSSWTGDVSFPSLIVANNGQSFACEIYTAEHKHDGLSW